MTRWAPLTRWVSERQAAEMLAAAGLSRHQARRVLTAGLAGEPVHTRAATLYDANAVNLLLGWKRVGEVSAAPGCGRWLVLRRQVSAVSLWDEQVGAVATGWRMSPFTALSITADVLRHGSVPVVVTVAGFVAMGAEVVGITVEDSGCRLELRPAGRWFDDFRHRRLTLGAGHPWQFWGVERSLAPADL